MMKHHRSILVRTIMLVIAVSGFTTAAQAQENYPVGTFAVGEQVTSDPMAMNQWRTCTVTALHPALYNNRVLDSISINCDGLDLTVPARDGSIRKGGGAANANRNGGQAQRPQAAANAARAPTNLAVPQTPAAAANRGAGGSCSSVLGNASAAVRAYVEDYEADYVARERVARSGPVTEYLCRLWLERAQEQEKIDMNQRDANMAGPLPAGNYACSLVSTRAWPVGTMIIAGSGYRFQPPTGPATTGTYSAGAGGIRWSGDIGEFRNSWITKSNRDVGSTKTFSFTYRYPGSSGDTTVSCTRV
jgi:pyruvate/2-oxoglutarate dehydrogenase complex dihydrolipoamide acyltransferase (E2) component